MAKAAHIPQPAVRRLSLYLRYLDSLQGSQQLTISSRQLGGAVQVSDVQIRKDLAYFGQFGQPGVGYRIAELTQQVRRILGTDRKSNVLLVGAGNLGQALLAYRGFGNKGFEIVAVFDSHPSKIGQRIAGPKSLVIQSPATMTEIIRKNGIRLGILAVPAAGAQTVADLMVAAGIRAILNFAPVTLQTPKAVAVTSVDLAVQLEQLAFQLSSLSG